MRNLASNANHPSGADGGYGPLVDATADLASQVEAIAAVQRAQEKLLTDLRIRSTPILTQVERLQVHFLPCGVANPIFNPSAVVVGSEILFMSRSSTLIRIRDKVPYYTSLPHDTINILHRLDQHLRPVTTDVLDDGLLRRDCRAAQNGVEDCRLFHWKGALWALGAGISSKTATNLFATQILFRIEGNTVVEFFELASPLGKLEKNWIPHVRGERLFFVYSFLPTIIYEFSDGIIALRFNTGDETEKFLAIRGGTPFIPWKGGLLGVVHEAPLVLDRSFYRHMFVFMDENLNLIELGEPWFIRKRGIEFACGLVRFNDTIQISFGLSDRFSAFCELTPDVIDRWITT